MVTVGPSLLKSVSITSSPAALDTATDGAVLMPAAAAKVPVGVVWLTPL